jgi:hypothetical protein
VTDLGGHARRRHQDGPGAARDLGVHEGHVHPVPESSVSGDALDLLRRRDALAGQRGLVDLERGGGQDARVGRDQVAGLDVDDVTRDELVHGDLGEVAVPADLRLDHHHLLERGGARLRLALLVHRHPGVEERQQDEEDAGEELAGQEEAGDAGHQEHDLHRVGVLAAELLPARRLLGFGDGVRADRRAPCVRLGGSEPSVDRHALALEGLVGVERVPATSGLAVADPARAVMPFSHAWTSSLCQSPSVRCRDVLERQVPLHIRGVDLAPR